MKNLVVHDFVNGFWGLRSGRDLALNLATGGRHRKRQLTQAVFNRRPAWRTQTTEAVRAMKAFEDDAAVMNFAFDSAQMLQKYIGVRRIEDLRAVREASLDWLQSINKGGFAVPFDLAQMLQEEYLIPDFMELHESERLLRGEGHYFESSRTYGWVTRFSGGPSTFGSSRTVNIRFAPELLERIPWILFGAALVRHFELVELMGRNEKEI